MNAEFGGHLPKASLHHQEGLGTRVLKPADVSSATVACVGLGLEAKAFQAAVDR